MSEQYHPIVQEKMVTDKTSENFGRISDEALAHDVANIVDQKVSKEDTEDRAGSGDFYKEDIESASDKQTAIKIGEIAALNGGYSPEAAAHAAVDLMAMTPREVEDVYKYDTDTDRDMIDSMNSSLKLGADAYRQKRNIAREERRAA